MNSGQLPEARAGVCDSPLELVGGRAEVFPDEAFEIRTVDQDRSQVIQLGNGAMGTGVEC